MGHREGGCGPQCAGCLSEARAAAAAAERARIVSWLRACPSNPNGPSATELFLADLIERGEHAKEGA